MRAVDLLAAHETIDVPMDEGMHPPPRAVRAALDGPMPRGNIELRIIGALTLRGSHDAGLGGCKGARNSLLGKTTSHNLPHTHEGRTAILSI